MPWKNCCRPLRCHCCATVCGALSGNTPALRGPAALLTGLETRTSSPLRMTRGEDCVSSCIEGLYPAGEGAGYAGGIVSAAVDGLRVAQAILSRYGGLAL